MRKPWPAEFKWRQFEPQLIVTALGWYLRYSLSYRDVEELLEERGLSADHVTVWRWVQRYSPELERRLRQHLKPTNKSWRVDETYIRVRQVDVSLSSGRFQRGHNRLSAGRQTRNDRDRMSVRAVLHQP